MSNRHPPFYYGVVGDGPDSLIAAYGSTVAMGIPETEQKAWACPTCTFWNTETVGRFCSMCGSRRFVEREASDLEGEDCKVAASTQVQGGNDDFDDSNNDSNDQLGISSIYVFSPQPEDRRRISSLSDGLSLRGSSHHRPRGLEKSFTIFGLLEENDADAAKPTANQGKPATLSAKEFQMSFANWSVSDQGAWTCPACTFVNTSPLHLQCDICGQNRPPKTTHFQSQKVLQEMMETSFRSGQTNFLKKQQEKIEEIEERVILEERMRELSKLQGQMLADFEAAKNNGAKSLRKSVVGANAMLSESYLEDLERVRREELEEQNRVENLLRERRAALSQDLRSKEGAPEFNRAHLQTQQHQLRAQENLLSQWKSSFEKRESDISEIRRRQEEIMRRWHHDTI